MRTRWGKVEGKDRQTEEGERDELVEGGAAPRRDRSARDATKRGTSLAALTTIDIAFPVPVSFLISSTFGTGKTGSATSLNGRPQVT